MAKTSDDTVQKVLSQAEDVADGVLRRFKHYLPFLARLCLIATFLEDGFRMWVQWNEQRDYINLTWGVGTILSNFFVVLNMVAQIGGCVMVLIRKHVPIAVGILFGVVVLQTLVYTVLWDFKFFIRNLSLSGALLLLLAESSGEVKTMFAGLPSMGINQRQNYMQLAGRVLVVFMFLTLFKFDLSPLRIIMLVGGAVLTTCVFIGYKTKLAAIVLVILLAILNVVLNSFWSIPYNRIMRDFVKYDFFQTLSVIGGLLFVVALGPGGVSVDERKRE